MGDNNPCNAHVFDDATYCCLGRVVEIGRAFVEYKNGRSPIKRPRQYNALLLPGRKGCAHISDK